MTTTFVVGLRAEARLLHPLPCPVAIGGGGAVGAEAAVQRAIAAGATALVSFGLAAGLDPALRPGAVLIPNAVLCGGEHIGTDPELTAQLGGAEPHLLLAAEAVAATVADKHRLWRETGAAALDLESGAVARLATARRLPFAVLRAVCDPAERDLPPAALAALDAAGAIGLTRVAASVLRHPWQIPALLRLAADGAAARRALQERVTLLRFDLSPRGT